MVCTIVYFLLLFVGLVGFVGLVVLVGYVGLTGLGSFVGLIGLTKYTLLQCTIIYSFYYYL